MSPLFAFLHHVAAFTLVAALAVEFVLIRDQPSLASARKLQLADQVFGASSGIVLAVGLVRVFYLEKGASYYFHSVPFIVKLALFVVIGLISIYPTLEFLSWRAALKEGRVPAVAPAKLRTLRRIIHWELAGVVVLILCAALMARGVGFVGA